ncbi:hypothetical protein K505DRAFT_320489 [Melanomma pulvis-pyrius CBS 109.77]|uniref:Uncharacterized protein n=1 Tax=Melanomma pulvis-pyrius CBS 109.77 TaxID=1314802 RepID=A0A6A6XWJ4_9PLEO|nr:hypothetical protein K505DRAFT_320489 [Melanomma pulvis-pyrius CBS 109.77]
MALSPRRDSFTYIDCRIDYPKIEEFMPNFLTVFLCFVILLFTVLIESIFLIERFAYGPSTTAPASSNGAPADSAAKVNPRTHPSPHIRASRFVMSSFAMVPLCIAFGFRMKGLEMPHYPQRCIDNVDIAYPNWVAISIINILPFTIACTAWLRTLVDCVLVRWNTSLSWSVWPMVLPIVGPAKLIWKAFNLTRGAVLATMVGHSERRKEDIEMHRGEEGIALVGNMDGDEDEERDEHVVEHPPAYDEAVGLRSEVEAKNGEMV